MNTKLKAYFPMIRTREEILRDIQQNINLTERFYSWKEEQREEFLDFCTGVKGVKMLYDAFFKEIMNPETVPERLEDFLEVLLQRKVKIIEVLPGDSTRLADEQSLLIMDILVRFDDGSYCNVEVQKIGYAFPGERCRNVEGMMEMYSEELKILDRNTVKYMVDQMQEQIDNQKEKIAAQEKEIQMLKRKLEEQK